MEDQNKPGDVVDITGLVGRFKNRAELQKYAEMLFRALKDSVEKLKKLEDENKHLQELLKSTVPVIQATKELATNETIKIEVPNEQAIAEMELLRLKDTAMGRPLTVDETKRYDILTKNLILIKGKAAGDIKGKHKRLDDISDAELITLAKKDE